MSIIRRIQGHLIHGLGWDLYTLLKTKKEISVIGTSFNSDLFSPHFLTLFFTT